MKPEIPVEVQDVAVAKPCPKCWQMPNMVIASGWHLIQCPCGKSMAMVSGTRDEAIRKYNARVEELTHEKA